MRMKTGITISAAVIAAGVIGAGSAYAATTLTAKPTNLYGCIVGSTRTLEQVRTSPANVTKCKTGIPVTVNTDTVSPPSHPSYVDVNASSNGSASVFVTCPASHPFAVGGGVTGSWTEQIRVTISNVTDFISVPVPPVSAPGLDGHSWTASVNASQGSGSLIVYAVCAN